MKASAQRIEKVDKEEGRNLGAESILLSIDSWDEVGDGRNHSLDCQIGGIQMVALAPK